MEMDEDELKSLLALRQTGEPRRLSNAARDEFLALLEAEIEPTEVAKKAAAEFRQGQRVGREYRFEL